MTLFARDLRIARPGAEQGAILQTFYHASLDAYSGNREGWSRAIAPVTRANPHNPYYPWFTGEFE